MTRSIYRIDPDKDLPFAREFMETPVGIHSAGLQRILNVFRGEPLAGKYVLVEVQPHVKWQLAQLSGRRGAAIPLLDLFFTDLEEAERAIQIALERAYRPRPISVVARKD